VSVSLSGEDDSELRGYWEKLTEGASITEPLETAPWGDAFGMLTDRFGISWLVNIAGSQQGAGQTQEAAGTQS
jgi:PhnB protein